MRIALVDDKADIRRLLRQLLETVTSSTVVAEADDGDVAAQTVATSDADMVILDYHMPRVDGVEAARRIKSVRPAVEIVAFTSTADEAVVAPVLAAGARPPFDKGPGRDPPPKRRRREAL